MADILHLPKPDGSHRFTVEVWRTPEGFSVARLSWAAPDVVDEDPVEPHLKLSRLADELARSAEGMRYRARSLDPDLLVETPGHEPADTDQSRASDG